MTFDSGAAPALAEALARRLAGPTPEDTVVVAERVAWEMLGDLSREGWALVRRGGQQKLGFDHQEET